MSKKSIIVGLVIIAIISLIVVFYQQKAAKIQEKQEKLAVLIPDKKAVVIASRTCGCCKLYSEYLEKEGFDVKIQEESQDAVTAYKDNNGIPENLRSCHTTEIGDYIIEGHVPVEAIEKLFEEKPDIKGIALPGMPSASPGMPGPKYAPFIIDIITNDNKDGGLFLKM